MATLIKGKVKGSSIIEVTVAMVIASISFLLAASFFWQVALGSLYRQPQKAQQLAISTLNQTLAEGAFVSGPIEHEVYQLRRTIEAYQGSPSLLLVHIEVLSADERLLAEAKQLVYVEKDR